mmetsp:Transcript_21316/g.50726  ORF Transcript_21316/g.50726 Transcript_21316/m.50726 type:complete len:450 (-) Transcript_21316:222-1571(-)
MASDARRRRRSTRRSSWFAGFSQSLSLSSIIIAAKTPPPPPAFFFFLAVAVFLDDLTGRDDSDDDELTQALPPPLFFKAPPPLPVFLPPPPPPPLFAACCFPARTRRSKEASSSNQPRLLPSRSEISSRISSFRARVLVSLTDKSRPLALSSSLSSGTSSLRSASISLWNFSGAGDFGTIFSSVAFRCSAFDFIAASFSARFGFFCSVAASRSASIVSSRSDTCADSCAFSSDVTFPSVSTCFCIASLTMACFSFRSSTDTVSYKACSSSSRTTPSRSRPSRSDTSFWMSVIAAVQPFFWLHDRHRFVTRFENMATVDRAIISSGLPRFSRTEDPSSPPSPLSSSLSAPSPTTTTTSRILGKTTTVLRFFPVSCWSLKVPAHSRTQEEALSSSNPRLRRDDVTAFAQPSSYFCRPSFPAPVTKVIRIMSSIGKGSRNALVMLAVTVDGA